ncbi:MAG TPA: glycoside hydrolase family 16 protein [Phycisphaerae bacterium]|nr:glycoside hydrolase family 16 protein [Phycisphaerae bacterium]
MHQKLIGLIAVGALVLATSPSPAAPPASSVNHLWRLAFEDNFDGTMLNTNAWTVTDACASSICRHPENVEVSGGTLKLNTLNANPLSDPPDVDYTTGRIDSNPVFNVGYAEVRVRAAADSGIQSSVFSATPAHVMPNLLQAYEGDSNDGLTDWTLINAAGGTFGAETILDSADPFPGATDLSLGFHDYGMHWTEASELIWSADGAETARAQAPLGLYAAPTNFAIGSAIRNEDFGIPRNPVGTAMEVDSVRYYAKRDICLGCDAFDYAGGSLAGANGGKGWAGPWAVTSGSVEVEGLGENLGLTGAAALTPAGDRALGASGSIAVRPLGTGVALNLNADTYVSMLVRKDDAGSFRISFRDNGSGNVRWFFGADGAEGAFAGVTGPATTPNAFPVDETVLVLARMAAVNSGNDTAYLAVLRDGDLIPQSESDVNWIATTAAASSITMDYMDIDVYDGNVQIDEIRIGSSLADVLSPAGMPTSAESFDYADANLNGKDGGTGWGGAWLAAMALSNDDVSLTYPSSPSTQSLFSSGDRLVLSDGVAERNIADTFSLAEDNTYFMSFLANKTSDSELLVEGLDAADNSRWRVGLAGISDVLGGITSVVSSSDETGGTAVSLSYPPSVALDSNGSRIEQNGPGTAYRALSATVPSSTEGAQRWLSFLARKDSAGAFNVRVANTSNVGRWNAEVSADGTVRAEIFAGANSAPGVFPNDETVMVITQFIASAGTTDMVKIAIIDQNDPLPADPGSIVWDAEVTDSTSVTMSRLLVEVVSGLVELDEFRYGDSYLAVTTNSFIPFDVDSIDYAAGSIGGQGPWSGDLDVAGMPSNSLAYPSLTPAITFEPVGGRIDQSGAASAEHPLSVDVVPDGNFTRWVSFIARKDASGSFAVRTKDAGTGNARWNMEFNADGSVRAEINTGATSAAGLFPNDEDVLVISRFYGRTFPGLDAVDILLLRDGDTLPADEHDIDTNGLWNVHFEENTSVYMDALVIEALSGHSQLDELRYGNTYESVTSSGSNLFEQDSFDYAAGAIDGKGGWSGDLNVAGPLGGFADDTVFVLSMLQAHTVGGTDSDTVYVKVFHNAYDLPVAASAISDWDLIVGGNTGVFLSKLRITGTGPGAILLDELKVGTTYASVTNYAVPGDCDGDGDVDVDDFVNCFEPCLGGPGLTLPEGCASADLDGDFDVDLRDYALFSQSF